jgi:hypothetical protein
VSGPHAGRTRSAPNCQTPTTGRSGISAASEELLPHGAGAAGQVPAGPVRAALMLIVPYRSVLTERRRKISDHSSGTRDPACPTVRRPGAAVATDLEPVATYLEFLMAAITGLSFV